MRMSDFISEEGQVPELSPAAKIAKDKQKNNEIHNKKNASIAKAQQKISDIEPTPENPLKKTDAINRISDQRRAETNRYNTKNHEIAAKVKATAATKT